MAWFLAIMSALGILAGFVGGVTVSIVLQETAGAEDRNEE